MWAVRAAVALLVVGLSVATRPLELPRFKPRLEVRLQPRGVGGGGGGGGGGGTAPRGPLEIPAHVDEAGKDAYASTYGDDDDDDEGEEDDEEGLLAKVERELVAPARLVGAHGSVLRPGVVLLASGMDGPTSVFSQGAVVLMFELGSDVYRGLVLNRPLPREEVARARQRLRVAMVPHAQTLRAPDALHLDRDDVWWGVGGPVRSSSHEWFVVHTHADAPGAVVLGPTLAVGASDLSALLSASGPASASAASGDSGDASPPPNFDPKLLLYGVAQWLPGQLEREMDEGAWRVLSTPATEWSDVSRWLMLAP